MCGMADEHTGGMVALIPRDADAQALTVSGGEPVEELHLTLTYLGDDVTTWGAAEMAQVVSTAGSAAMQLAQVSARVMGHGLFNPDRHMDREPCAVYLVGDSAVLSPLRATLAAFAAVEQHEPYIPHITAGFGLSVTKLSYAGPVVFDRLRVALAEQVIDFPLGDPEEIKNIMSDVEIKGKMPAGLAEKFKKKGNGKPSDDKGGTADAGINNIGDLAKAVKAYKSAKADAKPELWKKIKAAASKLKATKMLEGLTPPSDNASEKAMFEAIELEYKVTSNNPNAVKLRTWWAKNPKGRALWKPGAPGDFNRLVKALRKHTPIKNPKILKGLAANIHHLALGAWPGREGRKEAFDWLDGVEVKSADKAEIPVDGEALMRQYKAVRSELDEVIDDDEVDEEPAEEDETSEEPADDVEPEDEGSGDAGVTPEEAYAEGLADDIDWTLEGDGSLESDEVELEEELPEVPDVEELDSPDELGETSEDDEDPDEEIDDIFALTARSGR